jgi:mRNA-degrading endonuclease RelE of RelBE toxin-antitoxin system
MSAAEVIEQIQKLPPAEQEKVAEFIRQLQKPAEKGAVSQEFKQLADKAFNTNAELFRKLAQ